MYKENDCAKRIRLIESEEILAVADRVATYLNPQYQLDRKEGRAPKLPDLLTSKRESNQSSYRLREMKYKLEVGLIQKAMEQLKTGAEYLLHKEPSAQIDRLEIVVPLQSRKLKKNEKELLGEPIDSFRYRFNLNGAPAFVHALGKSYEVTLLLL